VCVFTRAYVCAAFQFFFHDSHIRVLFSFFFFLGGGIVGGVGWI